MAPALLTRGTSGKRRSLLRAIVSIPFFALCLFGAVTASRTGRGRFLANAANHPLLAAAADRAVGLSPADPETHSARALVLYQNENLREAIAELERAVLLRPQDYLLWLQLGRARDEARNTPAALLALAEAIKLAPFYGDPRWQYGNVLYRSGRVSEALPQLAQAAASDPSLAPVLTDLVWNTYPGDAAAVERILGPHTDAARISLARFFVRKGRITEALTLFRAAGDRSLDETRRLMTELIAAKQFRAAYEVWSATQAPMSGAAQLNNGAFETPLELNAKGFGWRQEHALDSVTVSVDAKRPHSGSGALLMDWNGHASPGVPVLEQLVIINPRTRYRLSCFLRTEQIVTGGLPLIVISDAGSQRLLAQSKPFPQGTSDWQEYQLDFETPPDGEAIRVIVQRQSCAADPCPMFGRVWLDDFALRRE